MSNSGTIIALIVLTIVDISFYDSLGIACTKYASAAQRSTIDTSRTVFIWIVSVLLGLEKFVALEIPGFVILAFGTLLYNEILVIPWFGFNEWTKDAIAKRQAEEGK